MEELEKHDDMQSYGRPRKVSFFTSQNSEKQNKTIRTEVKNDK
jgi:hypothetical protein